MLEKIVFSPIHFQNRKRKSRVRWTLKAHPWQTMTSFPGHTSGEQGLVSRCLPHADFF